MRARETHLHLLKKRVRVRAPSNVSEYDMCSEQAVRYLWVYYPLSVESVYIMRVRTIMDLCFCGIVEILCASG
jgi:hypothetical protein